MPPIENLKKSMKNLSRSLLKLAALICLMPSVCFAGNFSIATRQIFNSSHWPQVFQRLQGISAATWQLQSLNRFIFTEKKADFRLKFEAELFGTHSSFGFSNRSANWQTDREIGGFKAIRTDSTWLKRDHDRIGTEIERFEISFSLGDFDLQLGRQPVSFGTSHYVSVMDILTPFQPGYLDSSFKPGIDALRFRTISGTTGELELILAAAENSGDNAILGRWRDTFAGFDIEIVGGRMRKRNFFSAGWEGERKQINFWGEIGLFARKSSSDQNFGGFSNKLAGSWIMGIEKDTGRDWRHGIAYFHQDFGARTSQNISKAYATLPFTQGWAFLAASDYLIVNSNKEVSPLINFNLNSMLSLVDRSILIQPVLNISLDDESDISLFGWFNSGAKPEMNGLAQPGFPSEFGAFPTGAGFILRRYF